MGNMKVKFLHLEKDEQYAKLYCTTRKIQR
jgi:hypothetical protein